MCSLHSKNDLRAAADAAKDSSLSHRIETQGESESRRMFFRSLLGMNCNVAATELDEITRTLIKSGLSKKRILKSNVLSLREKVRRKAEKRASRQDWNTERKTDLASRWHLRFEQLLTDDTYSDPSIKNARKFLSAPWLRDFLGNEPICRQKLEAWLKAAEKAARRREQKKIETDAVGIKNGTSEILSS